jgi:hypothetical protein
VVLDKNDPNFNVWDLLSPLKSDKGSLRVYFAGEAFDLENIGFINGAYNSAMNISRYIIHNDDK